VKGKNVGYIYLFVGYLDQSARSLNVMDIDYLESPDTRQLNGVYYPVWKDGGFTLTYTWEPIVFGISDGRQNALALFQPDQYGADAASSTYTVEGLYTFSQTGEQRYAQLTFQNGFLVKVFGFQSETDTGAPREITPMTGDTFTIYEKWLDLDVNGNVTDITTEKSQTLIFDSQPFQWVELYAAPGQYIVGFIVEDLDGNQYPAYKGIIVK
jgi:hypothetical protein